MTLFQGLQLGQIYRKKKGERQIVEHVRDRCSRASILTVKLVFLDASQKCFNYNSNSKLLSYSMKKVVV